MLKLLRWFKIYRRLASRYFTPQPLSLLIVKIGNGLYTSQLVKITNSAL